jgi:hypothetical protein
MSENNARDVNREIGLQLYVKCTIILARIIRNFSLQEDFIIGKSMFKYLALAGSRWSSASGTWAKAEAMWLGKTKYSAQPLISAHPTRFII